ncbi:uncharacterized protein NMK_0075 [Novimethylophilus kurashikiensis]|uniref:Dicarboxylate transport domain-containing protein n=1 Tax=Novimethylophilus kurashikiensis TaxID=1825523 RepID=A0A2R5F7C8_9PROT|nr:hypothetical protein [Novimethylophilus kurashikiensis]GBG12544.1 uncharacterized protein NMK_0075 [Novimethylophilus kurashikiensis]
MKAVIAFLLIAFTTSASAVSRIDIQIGQLTQSGIQAENINASLDMEGRWQGKAMLKRAELSEVAKNYKQLPVTVTQGTASGQAHFSGSNTQLERLSADIRLQDVAFNDTEGSHAGEKISATVKADIARVKDHWQWQDDIRWLGGEVFWQPLYFPSGGHVLAARGWWQNDVLAVEEGRVVFNGVGSLAFQGRIDTAAKSLTKLDLSGKALQAAQGYELLAKPFLDKTMLGNLEMAGTLDVQASYAGGRVQAFNLGLHDADVEDKNGRFAIYKVNAAIPWSLNAVTDANVGFDGGRILQLTLGKTTLPARLEGWSLTAPEWKIPVLDGVLSLQDISLALIDGKWHGHLATSIAPISMSEFSHAMGWPHMEGKLAASIPLVTYSDGLLTTDGAMGFDIFDGHITVDKLVMREPLGRAPRLNTDISMRGLDMDLLTRTFAFGAMEGRLDGDVAGLELSSWKPVKFDASFRSSPGKYPKKISQRAVENISALGGAGAAAAIQRSFLRFFKEFNYDRIGLSCRLRNGICAMDGVEPAKDGYIIVKGSGIPAITVMGYNHSVSWEELLGRLQRVTQGNRPVIK